MCTTARTLMLLLLCACASGESPGPSTPPPAPPPPGPPPPPPPPGQPGLTANVAMTASADPYGIDQPTFSPAIVTIQRTGSVTWTNNTGIEHSVTFLAATGAPADIPPPATGPVSRSFQVAGNFNFYCSVHPTMTGRVVVQ